jgi:ABC-2 type transport system permease protein
MKLLKAEMLKYKVEMSTYYADYIANLINTTIFFTGFFFLLKKDSSEITINKMIIGFIFWFFTNDVISQMGGSISEEKQLGTLDQIILKPVSLEKILFVRVLCWNLVSFFIVAILFSFLSILFKIKFVLSFTILIPFIITLVGLLGVGYILATLTLLYTKTASLSGIIQYILLFFTGAVIPLDNIPIVLKKISLVLPLTQGIKLSQKIIENQLSLNEIILSQNFLSLCLSSISFILIGLTLFKSQLRKAKLKGISNHY